MLLVAMLALPAAGCFQPMYAQRDDGKPGLRERLMGVDLPPMVARKGSREERLGIEVRNALAFKLYGNATGMPPTHRLVLTLSGSAASVTVNSATGLPSSENYSLNASYSLIEIATNKSVLTGSTFAGTSYDIPGQFQRFSRQRAIRDAEDRASLEIAENIKTRLASFFYANI